MLNKTNENGVENLFGFTKLNTMEIICEFTFVKQHP